MELLHRINEGLGRLQRKAAIRNALSRLSPHALADLGLAADEIDAVADLGARLAPKGALLSEVVALVRARPAEEKGPLAALEALRGWFARTDLGRRRALDGVWRTTYRRVRSELSSYSDRELMADLRMTRAEIGDHAAEAADDRVAELLARDPAFRGMVARQPAFRGVHA